MFWFFFVKKIHFCFTKKCHFVLNLLTKTLIYWDRNNFQAGNLQASRSVLLEFFLGRYLFNKMDLVKLIHLWTSNPVHVTHLLFKFVRSYWHFKCNVVNAKKTLLVFSKTGRKIFMVWKGFGIIFFLLVPNWRRKCCYQNLCKLITRRKVNKMRTIRKFFSPVLKVSLWNMNEYFSYWIYEILKNENHGCDIYILWRSVWWCGDFGWQCCWRVPGLGAESGRKCSLDVEGHGAGGREAEGLLSPVAWQGWR